MGVIILDRPNLPLSKSDRIYWAKIDIVRGYNVQREPLKHLDLLLLDQRDNAFSGNESVAILDCRTFVPEHIPVLKAISFQRADSFPFDNGKLLNIGHRRPPPDLELPALSEHMELEDLIPLVHKALLESDLVAIIQIRRTHSSRP